MAEIKQLYCKKCGRTLRETEFYGSNNLEKYPTGKLDQCKKCLTMHVNNWEPETFLWILQEIDIPWIPDEWHKLMATYAKDRKKVNGLTIIGRYISKMKLKQFREYRWKDNEFIQQLKLNEIETTMKVQGYGVQDIAIALQRASQDMPKEILEEPKISPDSLPSVDELYPEERFAPPPLLPEEKEEDYFEKISGASSSQDFDDDLTEEDRTFLRLKWGKGYRPEEWVRLEQLYQEMMNSYDIQTAGDVDTLKLVCKTSLKANQLLDLGDVDGATKMTKMYDTLMKAGKWTAAQNKLEENELVDSIGELVALCERDGFIPKYYTTGPQDHADRVIEDLQRYTHDLIMNESGLGIMLENAIKQIEEEKEAIEQAANRTEEDDENDLFNYDISPIEKEDYDEFAEFEASLEDADNEFLKMLEMDDV